jgi:hypothetical protein
MSVAADGVVVRSEHRLFYVAMAALLALTNLVGFGASYLLPVSAGAFAGPAVLHLHAGVAFAWTFLFLTQTLLVASGNVVRHQAMGLIGIALATAMVFSGLMVATKNMSVGIAAGADEAARAFAIVPFTIVLLFGGFFAAAIANINRPEVHKRLMLIASIMTMPPAAGRVIGQLVLDETLPRQIIGAPPAPIAIATIASLAADMFLIAAIIYDWRTRGRPHPAYLYGLAAVLAVQALRFPLSETPLWRAITDAMLAVGQ